jgi:hypothetical protein
MTIYLYRFEQSDAKRFVLEAIDEYWDWHFYQDEGTWYYEDKSERTQVTVGREEVGQGVGQEDGEREVVEKDTQ